MIFWLGCIALGVFLLIESIRFNKARLKIPVRIHVYGTRGKTSTTRYLYDVLRASGWRVLGKTTGDEPLLLLPDGSVQTLTRWGPARIHEYISCIFKASRYECDAIVFECMALAPESIVMAKKMFSPTHLVITNTRPDHQECMGKTPEEIADTLALSIAGSCITFALEDEQSHRVKEKTLQQGGTFYGVPYDKEQPPLYQTQQMVAKVVEQLGDLSPVHAEKSASNKNWPVFETYTIEQIGRFQFLNLFSANDVISSQLVLSKALEQLGNCSITEKGPHNPFKPTQSVVALLATRPDRPLRTKVFIEWLSKEANFTHCICVGWHQYYAYLLMRKLGMKASISNIYPMPDPLKLLLRIRKRVGNDFILVGLGNMHGYGEGFMKFLSEISDNENSSKNLERSEAT